MRSAGPSGSSGSTRDGDGQDVHPLTIVSSASVRDIGAHGDRPDLDARRFRINLEIDGCEPYEEDSWDGELVRVGEATIRVRGQIPRCIVTTLAPDTGEKDFKTLNLIARHRPRIGGRGGLPFGMYAEVVRAGSGAGRRSGGAGQRSSGGDDVRRRSVTSQATREPGDDRRGRQDAEDDPELQEVDDRLQTGPVLRSKLGTAYTRAAGCSGRQLLLPSLHLLAESLELVVVEDLARLLEHLVLFFLDVVLDVLLHDLELGAPSLVVVRDALDLGHHHVDDVVLLVAPRG